MAEKKVIVRKDWVSSFSLVGRPIINDYTFTIDGRSQKSNWIYNAMNLKIDCGEKHGVIDTQMMGGYSEDNENRIYVHGKKEDNSDDFEKQIIVDWSDRFNEEVLEEIGNMSFIDVGLEKTDKGVIFTKHFLSEYDAIAYVKEHLREDMVINVRGRIAYSLYNDTVQVRKNITYIGLSIDKKTNQPTTPDKYRATFIQSVLIDKDSASLKNIDKDKGVMFVDTKVLDYLKEYNGIEVKGYFPFNKQFEFAMDFSKEAACKKIMDKLFKVKKGYTQITFEGDLIEGGSVVTATYDDLPDDIRDLVDMGVYELEDACAKCTANGGREKRMVLKVPQIKLVGEDKVPVIQRFEERYTEDDLILDYVYKEDNKTDDGKAPFDTDETDKVESDGGDMDWLNSL